MPDFWLSLEIFLSRKAWRFRSNCDRRALSRKMRRGCYTRTRDPFDYVRTLVPPSQYRHWGVISTGNIIITNARRHENTHTQRKNNQTITERRRGRQIMKKINDVSRPPRPPPPLPVHRANARSCLRIVFLPLSATPAKQQQLDKKKIGISIRNDIYRSLVLVKYWLNQASWPAKLSSININSKKRALPSKWIYKNIVETNFWYNLS